MSSVVLVGGMPAGGKTTIARQFVEQGYIRLNRDTLGGKVDDLIPSMLNALQAGKNVVMDNLYASKASRSEALKHAKEAGADVHFLLMSTSLEDAQFNGCCRMMDRCGKILHPDDHKQVAYKDDPNLFPVAVLYKYRKEFVKPTIAEGFASVKVEKFTRVYPDDWVNGAVIFDFDGTLRTHIGDEKYPVSPDQVRAIIARSDKLKQLQANGILLLGASNQSGIAKGNLSCEAAEACFLETTKQLGVKFKEILYCPHKVPPITCYCRKPGVGMAVELIYKYNLDPRKCIYVGDMTTDKSFAQRAGFKYFDHQEYFK
jgi:HAD superfamily hydrolase (TIGR01662 family)